MASFVQAPTPVITAAVTSGNIVFASNVTSGNLLVCYLRMVSPQTVSDNLGDGVAWQRLGPYFGNNTPADKGFWWKKAAATGACTVSCSTGTSGTLRVAVAEYSGSDLLPQNYVQLELRQGGTTWQNGQGLSANNGDLVIAAIAGGTASDVVSAGASPPNAHLTKLDNNANGYIALEDSVNWYGGDVDATFTLSVGGSIPDGMAVAFGPQSYTPSYLTRPMPSGV